MRRWLRQAGTLPIVALALLSGTVVVVSTLAHENEVVVGTAGIVLPGVPAPMTLPERINVIDVAVNPERFISCRDLIKLIVANSVKRFPNEEGVIGHQERSSWLAGIFCRINWFDWRRLPFGQSKPTKKHVGYVGWSSSRVLNLNDDPGFLAPPVYLQPLPELRSRSVRDLHIGAFRGDRVFVDAACGEGQYNRKCGDDHGRAGGDGTTRGIEKTSNGGDKRRHFTSGLILIVGSIMALIFAVWVMKK